MVHDKKLTCGTLALVKWLTEETRHHLDTADRKDSTVLEGVCNKINSSVDYHARGMFSICLAPFLRLTDSLDSRTPVMGNLCTQISGGNGSHIGDYE